MRTASIYGMDIFSAGFNHENLVPLQSASSVPLQLLLCVALENQLDSIQCLPCIFCLIFKSFSSIPYMPLYSIFILE